MILRKGLNVINEKLKEKGYHFENDIPIRVLKQANLPVIVNCNCCNLVMIIVEAYVNTQHNTYYCSKCAEYVADLIEF